MSEPLSFYELVLRDDPRLDRWIVDSELHDRGIRNLLVVSIAGTTVYGAMVGLVAQVSELDRATAAWLGPLPMLTFPVALTLAFLGALAVCLPSFYFYTQLSSLDATFRIVTGQALRVQARTAALLLGVLPVYIAVALGAVVGLYDGGSNLLCLGIALPFVVGIAGLTSLARLSAPEPRATGRPRAAPAFSPPPGPRVGRRLQRRRAGGAVPMGRGPGHRAAMTVAAARKASCWAAHS